MEYEYHVNPLAEWAGEVPIGWTFYKGKYIFGERFEKGNETNLELLSPTQKYGVIPQNLYDRLSGMHAVKIKETTDLSSFKTVHAGDFCISLRSFQGGFEYSKYEGVVSPAYHILFAKKPIFDGYYKYLFKEQTFIAEMNSYCQSLRDGKNISYEDFGKTWIPYPPLSEQQAIASYLDSRCSKIDEIIEEATKSIEEYKELKQAFITETVCGTRCFEKKNTGNFWVPVLPVEWSFVRIKNLFGNEKKPLKVGPFGSQLTSGEYTSDGYWVYTQRVVLDNNFVTNNTFVGLETYERLSSFKVRAGDVLVTSRGSGTPGHLARVPKNFHEGILHPCIIRFTLNEKVCLYAYLRFVFEYGVFLRQQVDSFSNTTAIPVLYSDTLKNLYLPLPPIDAQKQIVKTLEIFEKKINALISEKQSLISDLQAYKKSLIYEVVTGKRRVV